jgi:hypothetical protein
LKWSSVQAIMLVGKCEFWCHQGKEMTMNAESSWSSRNCGTFKPTLLESVLMVGPFGRNHACILRPASSRNLKSADQIQSWRLRFTMLRYHRHLGTANIAMVGDGTRWRLLEERVAHWQPKVYPAAPSQANGKRVHMPLYRPA